MTDPVVRTALAPGSYRRAEFRWREIEGDFETRINAGWDILCCRCEATVLGRLWMPFSGGHILHGSSTTLDPRLVERDGPEKVTGLDLPRFGPPADLYAKRKGSRSLRSTGTPRSLHGASWLYCFVCNTGQAVEPDRALKREPQVIESGASPRYERPRLER